jgi:hypothetical protein
MDYNQVIQAIGSVGFPIVACCGMFYLYNKTITELTMALNKIQTALDVVIRRIEEVN